MTCDTLKFPNGTTAIVCSRGRAPRTKKCTTCGMPGALLCDGCDKPLCGACAVSPATEQDFCPRCFSPVFKQWLRDNVQAHTVSRDVRRRMFRVWVRQNPNAFDCLPRTSEGLAARALGVYSDQHDRTKAAQP